MKILVIEDVKFSASILQKILVMDGFQVITAYNGKDALTILNSDPEIRVVVSDLFLPDIDGFTIFDSCKQLKTFKSRGVNAIPSFILLTASPNEEDFKKAEMMGFVATLHKPLKAPELLSVLKSIEEDSNSLDKDGEKSKILLVDPSGKLQPVLQEIFSGTGYRLMVVSTAQDCIQCLQDYKGIRVVVCDTHFSDGNAIELLNQANDLIHEGPDQSTETAIRMTKKMIEIPPFVLLTDSDDQDFIHLATMSGFTDVIATPGFERIRIKQKLFKVFVNAQQGEHIPRDTILVVDDVGSNNLLTKRMLNKLDVIEKSNYRIIMATTP
ncbi:MAG: response regulator, partial [Cyanobacteria bacterium]|nr:response regulator [Cyanobacteriota bacterium]